MSLPNELAAGPLAISDIAADLLFRQARTVNAFAADTNFQPHLGTLAPHAIGLARQSGLIQVGYLITRLRAAGLHVGPMGGFDAVGVDAELFADNGWQSLLVLDVGQPAAENATRPRAPRLEYAAVARTV